MHHEARSRWTCTLLHVVTMGCTLAIASPAFAWWGERFDEEVDRLASALALAPGSVVADIGAGDGRFSVALAKRVGPTGRVYATEIDPKNLEKIRTAVRKAGLENVIVLQAGASETGLPAACCNAILMRGVYHHLTEPSQIDASVFEALRPGGLFAVIDFPPSIWLKPFTPKGIPKNRGGHGIETPILIEEVKGAGFELAGVERDWPTGWFTSQYCVVFRKPKTSAAPAPA